MPSAAVQEAPAKPMPASGQVRYTEAREPCADRNPLRNAYFGDLHVHTSFSYDARPLGVTSLPADAYRYARGDAITLPPYEQGGETVAVRRAGPPLDFAAVTDHAEFFGELALCADANSDAYGSRSCEAFRNGGPTAILVLVRGLSRNVPARNADICGDDGTRCVAASRTYWERTREMAEAAYDRSSSCSFTSFVAYEHSATRDNNSYHRNVIFRNGQVPELPISAFEAPTDLELFDQLARECLESVAGCDVLSIPHSSNLSSGTLFSSRIDATDSGQSAALAAQRRNAFEPVMEIFQHKGSAECFNGLPGILGRAGRALRHGGTAPLLPRLARGRQPAAVLRGRRDGDGRQPECRMRVQERLLSRNSVDRAASRVAAWRKPIQVRRDRLDGHALVNARRRAGKRLAWPYRFRDRPRRAPDAEPRASDRALHKSGRSGGRVGGGELSRRAVRGAQAARGVWNHRPQDQAAVLWRLELRRRMPASLSSSGNEGLPALVEGGDALVPRGGVAETGYAGGVPMGGDLPARSFGGVPRFIVAAERDAGSAPLLRLQVVKGWVDGNDQARYKVFDVAGDAESAGSLDLTTGVWNGPGHDALCAVFEDQEFDPDQPSFYYMRAVETPSLRWSWRECLELPPEARPAQCENTAPKVIRELAWSSPIWYTPGE